MTPHLSFLAELPQTLLIEAVGDDVVGMDPACRDPELAVADVVERWVRAGNVGLLGGRFVSPAATHLELVSSSRPDPRRQTWTVRVHRADWGAFRVLQNLLLARDLESLSVRAIPDDAARVPPTLDAGMQDLPELDETRLPFVLTRDEVVCSSRSRSAQITLVQPPQDAAIDAMIAALDLWAELVVFGGYAARDQNPRKAGGLPDGAILYDELTVAQSFSEAFVSSEAAFSAVVSYAMGLAERGAAVAQVAIQ